MEENGKCICIPNIKYSIGTFNTTLKLQLTSLCHKIILA